MTCRLLVHKNILSAKGVADIFVSLFGEMTKCMRELMGITKALSDPNRVRILLSLRRGELCVCQITELFGLATSTVSKHLSILSEAGLILSRKTGFTNR